MDCKIIEFYISKFSFLNSDNELVLDYIPAVMRRRLSRSDKYTLSVLNDVFTDEVQNIVYSSRFGEAERLFKMIEQYKQSGDVSPNTFSASVHNFPVGFFLCNNKKSIPYNAISACENTVCAGLLSALCSNYQNIVFSYTDTDNNKSASFGINIKKTDNSGKLNKYKLYACNDCLINDDFERYVLLFTNKIDKIKTPLFKMERV